MKLSISFSRALSVLVALAFCFAAPAQADQKIQQFTTAQGIPVWFVQANNIPMVDLAIDIDAGSRWDPQGLEGLSSLTTDIASRAVTEIGDRPALNEEALGKAMARLAVQRSESTTSDRVSLKFRFLSDPSVVAPASLLIAQQLAKPAFDPNTFERERDRSLAALKDELTQPQSLATRALWHSIYRGHPYGRNPTIASLRAIHAQDLRGFYERFWLPQRMTVSVVGDLSLDQVRSLLDQIFAPLASSVAQRDSSTAAATAAAPRVKASGRSRAEPRWPRALPAVPWTEGRRLNINHPASQAHIWLGLPLMARGEHADYFPMLVANHILGGGGFTSRLTHEVREKRGLSYSVFSAFQPQAQTGPFFVGLQTSRENAEQALVIVRQTLIDFIENGPTREELEAAKKNLAGGFALRLDTNRKLLDNLSQMAFYKLSPDYLDTWTKSIQSVTAAQVRDVLHRRLRMDRLNTVVVAGGAGAQQDSAEPNTSGLEPEASAPATDSSASPQQ
jgi:zinc protease